MRALFVCSCVCMGALLGQALAAEDDPTPAHSCLGINLAGPADWNTEYPFVDVFRLARRWISQKQGLPWGKGPPLDLDQHGWVRQLAPDCWAETPLCTGGHAPPGLYVCLYDGQGTIRFAGKVRVVSERPGRIVLDVDGSEGFFLQIRRTNPADPVRNIRVLMPEFEHRYQKELFHPAFLNRWQSFNTLRFMDWMRTNGSTISQWTDRPRVEDATWTDGGGIPLEVMIDLCNRLKANAWFCMPHRATDQYVREFARMVRDRLDPSLKVYIEYSNELWNYMFEQTRYVGDEGLKLRFAEQHWEAGWRFSAYRSVQIFAIWEQVFGSRQRLVRVIASQCNPYVSEQKLSFQDAFRHCDALAIAPYFAMNVPARAGGAGRLDAQTVSQWTVEQLLDHIETQSLPEAIRHMQEQKRVADKYGVALIAYEAGQHLVGTAGGENNEALTRLFHSANRHPRMGQFYKRYLDAWKQAGGQLCCLFSSVGAWSKWGSWGLLEHAQQTEADQPKFRAVMEWNRMNRLP